MTTKNLWKANDWILVREIPKHYWKLTGHFIPKRATVRNWIKIGKIDHKGHRVKLKVTTSVYGTAFTRLEWLNEFIAAMRKDGERDALLKNYDAGFDLV